MPLLSPTRILRAATQDQRAIYNAVTNWSQTLALPKSAFPARATPEQLETYRQRCADHLYEWQRENRPKSTADHKDNEFVLHDGPPYANGPAHVGHALNKVLKDLILRFELSRGKRVAYIPGWDCHGLPIELKALQKARTLKSGQDDSGAGMEAGEIRKIARHLATDTIETQKQSFRSWGVMGDWDAPYKTMNQDFEIRQLGVFGDMVRNGLISRHYRPVHWSPSSRTALAEAELEYDDAHKCTAAFVRMPFVRIPSVLEKYPGVEAGKVSALIWTTTPWTLPSNRALAVHNDIQYVLIKISTGDDLMVVAKDRVDHVLSHLPEGTTATTIGEPISGAELVKGNPTCWNMFLGAESPMIDADFVTATSGTGVVHMAPDHGMEDYQVCQQRGIASAASAVDDAGEYSSDSDFVEPYRSRLVGLDVQTEGVKAVLDIISTPSNGSLLLASHDFIHKNPIDWRTKKPIIVRATAQWFADVSAIKDRALASLEDVKFLPESGKTRLSTFIGGRSQWCISRQRAWGVPIPALYHKATGEVCITDESIAHIVSVINERGTDAWFSDPENDQAWLLPGLDSSEWVRGKDTMDVWFDSGTTWTSLEKREGKQVSDVYVEGTDQHRGWFQSSLLTSIAVQDQTEQPRAPYQNLITHGFVLDGDGKKMSKSLGNVVAPEQIVSGTLLPPLKAKKQKGKKNPNAAQSNPSTPQYDAMGPDVLRLWVASSDYTRDLSLAVPVLQEVQQALQKYRVTFKFLLGVLSDYPSAQPDPNLLKKDLSFADRVILHQLAKCSAAVHQAYGEYQFHRAVKEINSLIYNDLSAFYFEICKDRMYADNAQVRQHTQTVLLTIMHELTKMLTPVTPHLIEEMWDFMPAVMRGPDSTSPDMSLHPLRQVWATPYAAPSSTGSIEHDLEAFKSLSAAAKIAQEDARRAGHLKSGLACKIAVVLPSNASTAFRETLQSWAESEELAELLVVSQAVILETESVEQGAAWKYEQPFEVVGEAGEGEGLMGKVEVLPPEKEKCIRCWKYVAEETDVPCGRCRDVMRERGQGE